MYKNKKVSVIIPAAGSGTRMGTAINKVYLELKGKTILERTVEAFEKNQRVDRILVAVKAGDVEFCSSEILKKEEHPKLMGIIEGSTERCLTVYKALELIDDEDIVLIHDGARPLVEDEVIDASIEAVYKYECAIAGVPVKDTIKIAENGFVNSTPDRSKLYAIHTPQGFFAGKIREYMKMGIDEGFFGTDEGVFAEKFGKKVFIVDDKYDNIKITTSEDLIFAEAILMKREK